MTTTAEPVVVWPPVADAAVIREAAEMLDREEHRYVERFIACPAGCAYDSDVHHPKKLEGPEVCPNDCFLGTVEDEDAEWVQPLTDRLRGAAESLERVEALARRWSEAGEMAQIAAEALTEALRGDA